MRFVDSNHTHGVVNATIPAHGSSSSPADQLCIDSSSGNCRAGMIDTNATTYADSTDQQFTAGCGGTSHSVRQSSSAGSSAGGLGLICDDIASLALPPGSAVAIAGFVEALLAKGTGLQDARITSELAELLRDLGDTPPPARSGSTPAEQLASMVSMLTTVLAVQQLSDQVGSSLSGPGAANAQASLEKATQGLESVIEAAGMPASDSRSLGTILDLALSIASGDGLGGAFGSIGKIEDGLLNGGLLSSLSGPKASQVRAEVKQALSSDGAPSLPAFSGSQQRAAIQALNDLPRSASPRR